MFPRGLYIVSLVASVAMLRDDRSFMRHSHMEFGLLAGMLSLGGIMGSWSAFVRLSYDPQV